MIRDLATLFSIVVAAGCGTSHDPSRAACGQDGVFYEDDHASYCGHIVIGGGFDCPPGFPERFEIGDSVICVSRSIESSDLPPSFCEQFEASGGSCPAAEIELPQSDAGVSNAPTDAGHPEDTSQACNDGSCVDGSEGHLIVIGHDYSHEVRRTNIARLVGNAVLLGSEERVNVLVYRGTELGGSGPCTDETGSWTDGATCEAIVGTDWAISQTVLVEGRTWEKAIAASQDDVIARITDYDVFLIYAQPNATDAALRALGAYWQSALQSYLESGGIVVLLDGTSSTNLGTWQILDEADLFVATSSAAIDKQTVWVTDPSDVLARSVSTSYRAESHSVSFETNETSVVVRVGATVADPAVVVHKVFETTVSD